MADPSLTPVNPRRFPATQRHCPEGMGSAKQDRMQMPIDRPRQSNCAAASASRSLPAGHNKSSSRPASCRTAIAQRRLLMGFTTPGEKSFTATAGAESADHGTTQMKEARSGDRAFFDCPKFSLGNVQYLATTGAGIEPAEAIADADADQPGIRVHMNLIRPPGTGVGVGVQEQILGVEVSTQCLVR